MNVSQRQILKVGLAVTDENRILLVRKKGGLSYILPGGKPKKGERDIEALHREIREELGCTIEAATLEFLGSFTDVAADMANVTVTIRLYRGSLLGKPVPRAEIEMIRWLGAYDHEGSLAPSLRNQILPFLFSQETQHIQADDAHS